MTPAWCQSFKDLGFAQAFEQMVAVLWAKQPTTVVANDPDALKGVLKHIGGSQSDHWNEILATQAVQTLWLSHSHQETCDHQYSATVAGLMGIAPRDELEGMIAAQLLAT